MAALTDTTREVRSLPLAALVPRLDQPRQFFDSEELAALAQDIAENGIRERLQVRPLPDGRYDLLSGHRRRLAAEKAGLSEVPCEVWHDLSDEEADVFTALANLNRADLCPWEEGAGFRDLRDHHQLSTARIATRIGKSREYVEGRIALAEGLGEKAIATALEVKLPVAVLQDLAALPCRPVGTRRCPACGHTQNDSQGDACGACGHYTAGEAYCKGNPQEAAVDMVKHKPVIMAQGIIRAVREAYALGGGPVQGAMDLGTMLARPEVAETRHKLDTMLDAVCRCGSEILKHPGRVAALPQQQKDAVRQQVAAAQTILRQIALQAGDSPALSF